MFAFPDSPAIVKDKMPGQRAARNKVARILEHIAQQEKRCCWSGTADDADALRLAWWTVWFAAYQDSPLPFDAALRKVLGPRYGTYLQQRNLISLPCPPAVAPEDYDVDGRSGSQWVSSVLAYLDWRAGHAWRPQADRNHPERVKYTEASLELRQAQNRPEPRTSSRRRKSERREALSASA